MDNLYNTNPADLHITDVASLEREINKAQLRVKMMEAGLKTRLAQFPKETVKSAAGAVVPTFLTTKLVGSVASIAWNLVKVTTGHKRALLPLLGSAARAGLFSFLKKKIPAGKVADS